MLCLDKYVVRFAPSLFPGPSALRNELPLRWHEPRRGRFEGGENEKKGTRYPSLRSVLHMASIPAACRDNFIPDIPLNRLRV